MPTPNIAPANLEPVVLRSAGTAAEAVILPRRGNACATATLVQDGVSRSVVWSAPEYLQPSARPTSGGIPILCPFPGRLAATTMEFQGRTFSLEPRDKFGRPMHGLVHERPWRVLERAADTLTCEFLLSREAPENLHRWPADFRLTATWSLAPARLALSLCLEALGTMPAALGLHPYLPVPIVPGGEPEACLLDIPVRQWQPQHELLPSGPLRPAADRIGFPGAVALGDITLDDVFTDMPASNGWITTRLVDPAGAAISVQFEDLFSTCVLFTPPHRHAVCIEPYSVLPGAGSFDEAKGWRILEAGETLSGRMTITVE
jgi:aldose 1-epimerase